MGLSLVANIFLVVIKLVAAISSGSLSIVASAIDSLLDILAGVVLYFTSKAAQKRDPYMYPVGKSRLEPIGVIIFACIMGVSMFGVCQESVSSLIGHLTGTNLLYIKVDVVPLLVLLITIFIKLGLYLYCMYACKFDENSSVLAYMEDHRNDVLTNTFACIAYVCSGSWREMWWMDATFAILLCIYISVSWGQTAQEQVAMLVGKRADPQFLSQLTFMALTHHESVQKVDTIRAYSFGSRYLCEVHIVLPPETPLIEAHDIGESLETKIEQLESGLVERAFVHLDWETEHKPEHRQ